MAILFNILPIALPILGFTLGYFLFRRLDGTRSFRKWSVIGALLGALVFFLLGTFAIPWIFGL